ncbi:MAG: pantoate--beta-alanine ligase [Candidatus Omnitrophica bacterium]|nr:pantoate--beta-alanine ligase [Candidatus Omnitrophota bacterium]
MNVVRKPEHLARWVKAQKRRSQTIGFVPTMGALHEGHLSLVRAARKENDCVVASIFVNPAQFGPQEDLKKYPRPIARDRKLLRKAGVDILFLPDSKTIYPQGFSLSVDPGPIAKILCGKFRPGHFAGVATVVAKLFNWVQPDEAYFGAKDFQQCVVIQNLVRDLNFDLEVKILPTVREKDGLAMSSRNIYLAPEDRRRARVISQTLFWVRDQIRKGRRDISKLKREAVSRLRPEVDKIQYFEIADPETLAPLRRFQPHMVALTACFVGKTRLIDNVIIPGLVPLP